MKSRLLLALTGAILACSPGERAQPDTVATAEITPPAPTPVAVSPAQFLELKWIEGDWRGTGGNIGPFYERYRFADDSTIRQYTFRDSTLAHVTDSSTTRLRNGIVLSGSKVAEWQATTVDSVSWHFEPARGAHNVFTWTREPEGGWTASLTWPDGRRATYSLQPWTRRPSR